MVEISKARQISGLHGDVVQPIDVPSFAELRHSCRKLVEWPVICPDGFVLVLQMWKCPVLWGLFPCMCCCTLGGSGHRQFICRMIFAVLLWCDG